MASGSRRQGSVSSTSSTSSEEQMYVVERILAEAVRDGQMKYLVKWEEYPDNQCTWEPKKHFNDPDTIKNWETKLTAGDSLDDEVIADLEVRMEAYREEEEARLEAKWAARQNKRQKLVDSPRSFMLSPANV